MFENPFKTLQILLKRDNGDVVMLLPLIIARTPNIVRIRYFVWIVIAEEQILDNTFIKKH